MNPNLNNNPINTFFFMINYNQAKLMSKKKANNFEPKYFDDIILELTGVWENYSQSVTGRFEENHKEINKAIFRARYSKYPIRNLSRSRSSSRDKILQSASMTLFKI